MQSTDRADAATQMATQTRYYVIRTHEGTRQARFSPSQHVLIIYEGEQGVRHELNYTTSRILELLISRADTIVTREEIFAFAWAERVVGQNSLNQAISALRELLGDDTLRTMVQTITRRGYRFDSTFFCTDENGPAFNEPRVLPAIDIPEPLPAFLDAEPAPQPESLPGSLLHLLVRHGNYYLMALALVLGAALLWRIDWPLLLHAGLFSDEEQVGELDVLYTSESPEELEALKGDMRVVRERMMEFIDHPETVIFNKMHSFYEVVCIEQGKTVEFILVHKAQLSTLTNEQLRRCIK